MPTLEELEAEVRGRAPATATPDLDALEAEVRGRPVKPTAVDTPAAAPPGRPGQIDPITGKPFAFMGAPPPNDPVAGSMGAAPAEDRTGAGLALKLGFSTDQEQRRRIAASQLFPDMALPEALSRVFYGPDGRMAAVGKDGQPFYVEPRPLATGGAAAYGPGNLAALTAGGVGGSLPVAGGAVAGLAGVPGGPGAGIALSGAGAALGDVARQFVANRLLDPTGGSYDPMQTAREAAFQGAAQGAAGLANSMLSPNPLRVRASDLTAIRLPGAMQAADAAYQNAGAQGVRLTPGQATGLPSLLQYEDAAMNNPAFADMARDYYRQQGIELGQAGNRMLDRISPQADKTDAAMQFQQGAEDAISLARRNANAAARPHYDAAQGGGQVMSPDLAQLAETPAVQRAMTEARTEYRNLYRTDAPETPDFRLWDLTKRRLDDAFTVAQRAGERTTAGSIDSLRGDLVQHLDAAYPEYATARATAAPGQRLAARLEDTGTGTVADKTGAEKAKAITGPIFGENPRAIAESRAAFEAAGRGDEWQAGVRAHLQDAFDRASMSQQGLNASMLRRQVWGNADNREAMRAAMTPQQFEGFDRFMQTVEQVARTYPQNSLTAMRGNAAAELAGAAGSQADVRAVQMTRTILSPFRLLDVAGRVGDAAERALVARNMGRIVDGLFSENGMTYLQAMAGIPVGSQRAISLTSQFVAGQMGPRNNRLMNDAP